MDGKEQSLHSLSAIIAMNARANSCSHNMWQAQIENEH